MITSTLLIVITTILTWGHKTPFITPDLQKRVRKNVKDADRKKRVLEILKSLIGVSKRLDSRLKQYKKMLGSLASDRETTRDELSALFEGMLADYRQTQVKFIDGRLAVVDVLTAEEFEKCTDRDRRPSDKAWKKQRKSLDTHLEGMAKASTKAIRDPASREPVLRAIKEFAKDLERLLEALYERNYSDDDALGRYNAGRKEFIASEKAIDALREQLYRAFIDLHQTLAKATTDNQWKAAAKTLKALAK